MSGYATAASTSYATLSRDYFRSAAAPPTMPVPASQSGAAGGQRTLVIPTFGAGNLGFESLNHGAPAAAAGNGGYFYARGAYGNAACAQATRACGR